MIEDLLSTLKMYGAVEYYENLESDDVDKNVLIKEFFMKKIIGIIISLMFCNISFISLQHINQ